MAIKDTKTIGTKDVADLTREQVVSAFAGAGNKKARGMLATPPLNTTTLTQQKDAVITPPTPPVESAGLRGAIDAERDAFTENLTKQREAQETNMVTQRSEIQNFLAQLQGKTDLTAQAYAQESGVDDTEKELNDINQQLRVEQNALTRQVERITENSRGLFGGAVQDEVDRVERESLRKQADLSIIQMGIQGRYDSAKAIADRAVSAYMEKQDLILKTAMFNYEENKDLFTTAEQREFDVLTQNRQNEIDAEKEKMTAIYNLAIDAQRDGAPTSVVKSILGSKTLEDAIGVGWSKPSVSESPWELKEVNGVSSWVNKNTQEIKPVGGDGSNLKPVKDLEIRDLNDTWTAKNSMVSIIDNMTKSIEENGTKVFWGSEAGKRGANKTALLLAMKNLEKTGALDQGTIDVLSDLIPENEFWATEDRQIDALNQLKKIVSDKTDEFVNSYRGTMAETDPRTKRLYAPVSPVDAFSPDELREIDAMFGTQTSTQQTFNPASYY